jgi:hypothetical protein
MRKIIRKQSGEGFKAFPDCFTGTLIDGSESVATPLRHLFEFDHRVGVARGKSPHNRLAASHRLAASAALCVDAYASHPLLGSYISVFHAASEPIPIQNFQPTWLYAMRPNMVTTEKTVTVFIRCSSRRRWSPGWNGLYGCNTISCGAALYGDHWDRDASV